LHTEAAVYAKRTSKTRTYYQQSPTPPHNLPIGQTGWSPVPPRNSSQTPNNKWVRRDKFSGRTAARQTTPELQRAVLLPCLMVDLVGRAASGGALAPELPRATRSMPECRGARRRRTLADVAAHPLDRTIVMRIVQIGVPIKTLYIVEKSSPLDSLNALSKQNLDVFLKTNIYFQKSFSPENLAQSAGLSKMSMGTSRRRLPHTLPSVPERGVPGASQYWCAQDPCKYRVRHSRMGLWHPALRPVSCPFC